MSAASTDPRRTILELVRGHVPTGDSEARSLEEIARLVEQDEQPWSRTSFDPGHLTASAVVVDAPRPTRTLLVFHAKLQRWLQPGGHFEPEERIPADVAFREAVEETELVVRHPTGGPRLLDLDVHVIPARPGREPEHRHFDLRFMLIADDPERARPGDGTTDVRWATQADLSALDLDPGLVRALQKLDWAS